MVAGKLWWEIGGAGRSMAGGGGENKKRMRWTSNEEVSNMRSGEDYVPLGSTADSLER